MSERDKSLEYIPVSYTVEDITERFGVTADQAEEALQELIDGCSREIAAVADDFLLDLMSERGFHEVNEDED